MPERLMRAWGNGDSSLVVFLFAFFGASFAGLASQLRSDKALTVRSVLAAVLNSGLVGIIVALLGWEAFREHIEYLLGLSLLAGVGGATLLDFGVQLFKRRLCVLVDPAK